MVIFQNESLIIHRLLLNEIKTNCFIVQSGSQALLVDPTDSAEQIIDYLKQHRLKLNYMMATHGHFDHISGAAGVIANGLVDVLYVHENDFPEVKRAPTHSLVIFKRKMHIAKVAMFDAAILTLLHEWGLSIQLAGGHTKGSCYLADLGRRFIITGDLAIHHKLRISIFNARENNADFAAFVNKIERDFEPDAVILPGHGDRTTVGTELSKNKKWAYVRDTARGVI